MSKEKKNKPFSEDYEKIYNAIIDDMTEELESLDDDDLDHGKDKTLLKFPIGGDITHHTQSYLKELLKLQIQLVKLQDWVKETGYKLVILYLREETQQARGE
jgi:polyphosphate kinase 2 (PPK2 family)